MACCRVTFTFTICSHSFHTLVFPGSNLNILVPQEPFVTTAVSLTAYGVNAICFGAHSECVTGFFSPRLDQSDSVDGLTTKPGAGIKTHSHTSTSLYILMPLCLVSTGMWRAEVCSSNPKTATTGSSKKSALSTKLHGVTTHDRI